MLAANHIQEKQSYRSIIKNGKVVKDSIFYMLTSYSPLGLPMKEFMYDSLGVLNTERLYEYLNDTLELSVMSTKKGQQPNVDHINLYDSLGHLIKTTNHYYSNKDSSYKTYTYYMVYDEHFHKTEVYYESGKTKQLSARYTYDEQGRTARWYHYYSGVNRGYYKLMVYDARNNAIRYYACKGKEKRLVGRNTYNAQNQLIEQLNIYNRDAQANSVGFPKLIIRRDRHVTKLSYNDSGLVTRQMDYFNGKLRWQSTYTYK